MLKPASSRTVLVCFVLALGTLLVYAPARHFDFVNYDDQVYVINNFNVNRGPGWPMLRWAFNVGYDSNWHPLTWISHALDCGWFGLRAGPAHMTSVVLHTLTSTLLFLFLESLTGRLWRSAFVAALFAWHPMHVESVAWISERKDVLSGLFFILTLWAYAASVKARPARPRQAPWLFVAAIALFALGLMAKPMVVTLPFILLLLDFWPLQCLAAADNAARRLMSLCREKIPFFALSAISCVLTLCAQKRGGAIRALAEIPFSLRVMNALVSYRRYLAKLAWPRGLSVTYPFDSHLSAVTGVGAALALLAVSAFAVSLWKRRPYCLMGWLWFLGALVPVIGLVQVGGQAMADRYTYLPSIGLFIALSWLLSDWAEGARGRQWLAAGVGGAALAACLCLTHTQLPVWKNGVTLSQHSIDVDPGNVLAHSVLTACYINMRDVAKARVECEKTLKLDPNYAPGHEYVGSILYMEGDYQRAAQEMTRALKLAPYKLDVHLRLGDALLQQGEAAQAEEQYRAYLAYDSADPAAHCGLGKALVRQGRLEEGGAEFAASIKIVDANPEAHYQLASTLTELGRRAAAEEEYRKALQLAPANIDAMNNLAWLLAASPDPALRDGTNAVALAERACALTTNREPLLIGTLADAYAEAGRFDEAVATAQRAREAALAQTNAAAAARNLQLMEIYRSHHAFHEE